MSLDSTSTSNPRDQFLKLRSRARCGECGRVTIPAEPTVQDCARFLDELEEKDDCGTCAFVWLACLEAVMISIGMTPSPSA